MTNTMQLEFANRIPMQSLEERGILVLYVSEKDTASESLSRGDCLIDQSGPDRPAPEKGWLPISYRYTARHLS